MKKRIQKIIAIMLMLAVSATILTSCGSKAPTTSVGDIPSEAVGNDDDVSDTGDDLSDRDDVSYVMIYNPDIYDENSDYNTTMTTGEFGDWISPQINRSSDVKKKSKFGFVSQDDINSIKDDKIDKSASRAAGKQPKYKAGDTHSFYYLSSISSSAASEYGKFNCKYKGKNCYMWTPKGSGVSKKAAKKVAKEFDKKIYKKDVEMFGTPRFVDEGGKIHLLFHPMEGALLGYFSKNELFTSQELSDDVAEMYQVNRDHAIIHINSNMLGLGKEYDKVIFGTLAHEFQHLINGSDRFYRDDYKSTSTWLNESMSGYAEEFQYPGVKDMEGHYEVFARSDLIRHGQSMYSFKNENGDIGVYGSVFLFSQYLTNVGGKDVFRKVHDIWRDSAGSDISDASALHSSVSSDAADEIDGKYKYPSKISFSSQDDEWMSKLTLDFYLSLLKYDSSDPQAYEKIDAQTLLYDEFDPAEIEGGGRVIVATKNGKFKIPTDAGRPLVYIGFDEDFNQITGLVCK